MTFAESIARRIGLDAFRSISACSRRRSPGRAREYLLSVSQATPAFQRRAARELPAGLRKRVERAARCQPRLADRLQRCGLLSSCLVWARLKRRPTPAVRTTICWSRGRAERAYSRLRGFSLPACFPSPSPSTRISLATLFTCSQVLSFARRLPLRCSARRRARANLDGRPARRKRGAR